MLSKLNPIAAGGKKSLKKMTETLAYGYLSESTQRELSKEYQHDRVLTIFKNCCALVFWTKVASALEEYTLPFAL